MTKRASYIPVATVAEPHNRGEAYSPKCSRGHGCRLTIKKAQTKGRVGAPVGKRQVLLFDDAELIKQVKLGCGRRTADVGMLGRSRASGSPGAKTRKTACAKGETGMARRSSSGSGVGYLLLFLIGGVVYLANAPTSVF
jgi:hypothetical protein